VRSLDRSRSSEPRVSPLVAGGAPPRGQSPVDTSSDPLLYDDFKGGFDLADTWALVRIGSFTADDRAVTTSPSGLEVEPRGMNPVTGEPAFTLSAAGEMNLPCD
jgi:Family of unknown function (DUF6081)